MFLTILYHGIQRQDAWMRFYPGHIDCDVQIKEVICKIGDLMSKLSYLYTFKEIVEVKFRIEKYIA